MIEINVENMNEMQNLDEGFNLRIVSCLATH